MQEGRNSLFNEVRKKTLETWQTLRAYKNLIKDIKRVSSKNVAHILASANEKQFSPLKVKEELLRILGSV